MELRHLRYFVAIAEESSFTRAAERLWVAQPGLSTQIRRLERELGIRLFSRHSRGVDLTAAGELFLERARIALAAAEDAQATGRDLTAGVVGSVRVGLSIVASSRVAPLALAAFAQERPAVEVTVFEAYGGSLVRDLRDRRLDAVYAAWSFAAHDLRALRLGGEPWVVVVGRRHPLAAEGPISATALAGHDIVVTGHRDGADYDVAVSELLTSLGVTTSLVAGGPGRGIFAAVVAGEALALTTASSTPPGGEVIVRPLDPIRRLQFRLLWRREPPSPALAALVKVTESHARLWPRERRMTASQLVA
jgi:DNA-binding transcriptional LysR family regulator